jgi:hypothetical protein
LYSTETTTSILGWTEEDLKDQLITKVFPAKSTNEIAPADLTPSEPNPEEAQPSCPFGHSGSATSNPHNENDLELTDVNLPGSVEETTTLTNENNTGSRPSSKNENKSGSRPGSSNENKSGSRPGSSNENNTEENQTSTAPVNAGYPVRYDEDTKKTRIGDMGKFTLEANLEDGTTAPVNVNVIPSLIDGDYIYTFVIENPDQEEEEAPKGKSFDHIHDTASDFVHART